MSSNETKSSFESAADEEPAADIATVQAQHEEELMNLPGVNGVGIGECDGVPCLKVFVLQKTPALESQIPAELGGFKVEIEEVGSFNIFEV